MTVTKQDLAIAIDAVLLNAKQLNKMKLKYDACVVALSKAQLDCSVAEADLQNAKTNSEVLIKDAHNILAELITYQFPAQSIL